jgi:hypothetical protein
LKRGHPADEALAIARAKWTGAVPNVRFERSLCPAADEGLIGE